MLTRVFTLTVLTAIGAVCSSNSADQRNMPDTGIDSPEFLDLDKSWTSGGQENENGSQVTTAKALASRVSFQAERTGFQFRDFASRSAAGLNDRKSSHTLGLRLLTCERL